MAGGVVDMQRLPLAKRRMALQFNDDPLRGFRRRYRQQPVAAVELLFLRIAGNIQGDALAGPRFCHRLILRVQAAHAHRFIHAGQPQRIANVNLAG